MATRKLLERVVNLSKETPEDKSRGQLSPREIEILRLAARGMSNRDIAEKLELSMRTVKAHLSNIFNKMRCSSRTEAIVKGFREGYVTLDDVPQGIETYEKEKI
jgi:DNA-binding NarL/FixJ family response regulator